MTALIVGIGLTILVLILSLVTITKGYSYKHSVDPIDPLPDDLDEEKQV